MLRESERWTEAARTLTAAQGASDASYILRLLSFELLLKALVEQHAAIRAPKHHRYAEIFKLLPDQVGAELLELAGQRIGPSELSTQPIKVLEELGGNFAGLRYPWERYEGLSEKQYDGLGPAWVAAGAPDDQAKFRHYPEELYGLTEAARSMTGRSIKFETHS